MTHEAVHSDRLSRPVGVFEQGVRVPAGGHLIFASGMTSRARDGSVVGKGDARAQTRKILENLQALLAEAGATLDDVFKVTVYVKDMNDFKAIHDVRREFFMGRLPASTMVEVNRFVDDDMLVEIEAIAHVPG